jgi:hypothetical protein
MSATDRPNKGQGMHVALAYWRWKSRRHGGRPKLPADIRRLIVEMSIANTLWGAPRIHGELLKLGIDVGQTTVAKYIAKRRRPTSQVWKTFLRNHADGIASIDMFVVPTISFRPLCALSDQVKRFLAFLSHLCIPSTAALRISCRRESGGVVFSG